MKKVSPPLRNYQQMVRVIRDKNSDATGSTHVPYKLGHAYAETQSTPWITRERTLDELGMNGRTTRQPENTGNNNYMSSRETSINFHKLNDEQRAYFRGVMPKEGPTRQDGWPGTKSRAWLDSDASAEKVTIPPPRTENSGRGHKTLSAAQTGLSLHHHPFQRMDSPNYFHNPPAGPKKTKLPIVKAPDLTGTQGSDIGFDLSF